MFRSIVIIFRELLNINKAYVDALFCLFVCFGATATSGAGFPHSRGL